MSATSLIDLKSLTAEALSSVFSVARTLSQNPTSTTHFPGRTAGLIFFEPSTRTRMSFEMACAREGVVPVTLSGEAGSSLEKGESFEDTILNVAAMKPDVMIIRCGDEVELAGLSQRLSMPVINAGWGRRGHPTQALLDAFTLHERWGSLEGKKLLVVGDVRHSRVAASHFELSSLLGYEIALAGPPGLLPSSFRGTVFSKLSEGLAWADAVMGLRVQRERHGSGSPVDGFSGDWRLGGAQLKLLRPDALILHPGPVNWGVEFAPEVMDDPRSMILEQVTSGTRVRQALIRRLLEGNA